MRRTACSEAERLLRKNSNRRVYLTAAGFVGVFGEVLQQGKEC